VPIYTKNWDNLHPGEVMMGMAPDQIGSEVVDRPMLVTAGDYVLVASGTGPDVKSATTAVYKTLKGLEMPNSPMYRTDIGTRLRKQLPLLQATGYAQGMEYSTPPQSLSA
jgi:hypothetical protein